MHISDRLKRIREENHMSQEQLAAKISVSRQAISKWETGRGYPDIENLIAISEYFGIGLDELIKSDVSLKHKIVRDSNSKKWHLLVIAFLIATVVYILYFAFTHNIYMIGFAIATIFMLVLELRIFFREKIHLQKNDRNE